MGVTKDKQCTCWCIFNLLTFLFDHLHTVAYGMVENYMGHFCSMEVSCTF